MKKNNGITIIALIITTIILLILAGMSLQLIAGKEGLLKRASGAATENEIAKAKEAITLYVSEYKVDYFNENQTVNFIEYLRKFIGKGTKINSCYITMVNDEIIAYKSNTVSLKNKIVTGKIDEEGNIEWIENDNSGINIIATPYSMTGEEVESQTVEIKVESQNWVDWEAKYNLNRSNTQSPEEWNPLTLTGDGTQKEGSVTISSENSEKYYLWIKITTNGQEKIKSFGPYKLGARPNERNIICTMTSTSDNETKGVITVGSNKVFKDWKLVYKVNNGSYNEIEQGKTIIVNVVKNDLVEVKYTKKEETDVIKSLQATELKIGYTLQYDANEGTSGPSSVTQYDNAIFTISNTVPIRTGYTFENWNTSKDGSGITYTAGDTISITEITTLYAIWKEILVEITFDANGGSGTMNKIENIKYNTKVSLPVCEFLNTGYCFTEWNTSADGSGTAYTNKATITPNTNMVLYAQWEVQVVDSDNYGEYVDLGTNYVKGNSLETGKAKEDWRIFYKSKIDRTNLDGTVVKAGTYLILADFLPYSYETKATAGSSTGLGTGLQNTGVSYPYNWKSTTSRIDLLNRLKGTTNSNAWNKLLSSEYITKGISVKGGADLETWIASWNAKGYTKLYTAKGTEMSDGLIGYYIGTNETSHSTSLSLSSFTGSENTLYFPRKSIKANNQAYMLNATACVNNVLLTANYNRNISKVYNYKSDGIGVRPVVYIPLDIGMEKDNITGVWRLIID